MVRDRPSGRALTHAARGWLRQLSVSKTADDADERTLDADERTLDADERTLDADEQNGDADDRPDESIDEQTGDGGCQHDETTVDADETIADGGRPPAWDGEDPIEFDDGDDGESLLEAVGADESDTTIDLAAELADAADGESGTAPDELDGNAAATATSDADEFATADDGTDAGWEDAVQELIDAAADQDDASDSEARSPDEEQRADVSGDGGELHDRSQADSTSAETAIADALERAGTDLTDQRVDERAAGDGTNDDAVELDPGDAVEADVDDDVNEPDVGDAVELDVGGTNEVDAVDAVEADAGDAIEADVGDANEADVGDAVGADGDDAHRDRLDDTDRDRNDGVEPERSDDVESDGDGPVSSPAETNDGADDGESDAASELRDRLDDVESEHDAVATSVSSLETELDELRGDVDGIRSDLGTLVDLVKQTAQTRGGTVAEPAEAPSTADGEPTPDAGTGQMEGRAETAAHEQSGAGSDASSIASDQDDGSTGGGDAGADAVNEDVKAAVEGAEPVDESVGGVDANAETADEAAGEPKADAEVTDGAAGEGDQRSEAVAADPTEPSSVDQRTRERVDPRSEAGERRLREYRPEFDGERPAVSIAAGGSCDAAGDDRSGAGDSAREADRGATVVEAAAATEASMADAEEPVTRFEFEKVLFPADADEELPVATDLEPPYLTALPTGYAAEAAVIEWLDGLVERSEQETTVQALRYYQSIGWIDGSVREQLVGYLSGLGEIDEDELPDAPPAALALEDHRRSLEYVTRLAEEEVSGDGI